MRATVITLLLVLTSELFAQNVFVCATVVDSTGAGIPYAKIVEVQNKFGVLTDANGNFIISIPDSLEQSQICISCIGYDNKTVPLSELIARPNSSIQLNPRIYQLDSLTVTSSRAKYCATKRGCLSRKSRGGFLFRAGYEICLFIPTLPGDSEAVISSVRYFIGKKGFPTSPFRITLYDVDSTTKGPGNSLLTDDTIVHANKGGAWFEIDIRSFNIAVPPNGFFVGMQWLPEAQAYTANFGKHQAEADGQSLGLMKDETQVMWLRNLTMDWRLNSMSDYYPMIGATITTECPDK